MICLRLCLGFPHQLLFCLLSWFTLRIFLRAESKSFFDFLHLMEKKEFRWWIKNREVFFIAKSRDFILPRFEKFFAYIKAISCHFLSAQQRTHIFSPPFLKNSKTTYQMFRSLIFFLHKLCGRIDKQKWNLTVWNESEIWNESDRSRFQCRRINKTFQTLSSNVYLC